MIAGVTMTIPRRVSQRRLEAFVIGLEALEATVAMVRFRTRRVNMMKLRS